MDSKERARISEVVREQISELESSIEETHSMKQQLADHPEEDEAPIEILSNATANETAHIQMKIKLERLRDNLDWLESAHGGKCVECGCEIPAGRLTIVPTTRLCVDCSSKHENKF